MKIKSIITVVIALLFTVLTSAQSVSLSVQVIALPKIDLGSLIVSKDISGAPRIFALNMAPAGVSVYMVGEVYWQSLNTSEYKKISSYTTKPFVTKSAVYNNEIGVGDIKIQDDETNSDLVDENVKKGVPTGRYRIVFSLYDPTTNALLAGPVSEILEFLNPTQTLQITSPTDYDDSTPAELNDETITWTQINGVKHYLLTVRERDFSQSRFENIRSGTPIIDRLNVGKVTSANIKQLQQRNPTPYKNTFVVQVEAVIEGPGGEEIIYSNVPHFDWYQERPVFFQVSQTLTGISFDDYLNDNSPTSLLLNGILSNSVNITGFTDEFGNPINPNDAQATLNYLKANPNVIIDVTIENN